MLLLALSLFTTAEAGSLDLLEVGGPWGTPGATNPTAIWWNPAGLAVQDKPFQFIVSGSPTMATVNINRDSPDYGPPGDVDEDGVPIPVDEPYDYGGQSQIKLTAVVPFIGVQSNLGVKNLGVGAGLFVPFALGGRTGDKPPTYDELLKDKKGADDYYEDPISFFLRDGNIQAVYTSIGAGYHIADKVALGVTGSLVDNTWYAVTDVETLSTLEGAGGALADYADREQLFESRDYKSTLHFDHLKDRAFTLGTGIYVTPVDGVGISVAFNKGFRLENTGNVMVTTGCPPEEDSLGRLGVEAMALCNATTQGTSTVSYNLPSRVHGGVVLDGIDRLRLEAMGGWVGWSAFTDYEIQTRVDEEAVDDAANPEAAAELISQDRLWARGAQNSFWVGVDAKGEAVQDTLTLGGRVLFDKAALPTEVVAGNNFDADRIHLGAVAAVGPFAGLSFAGNFTQQVLFTRTVENSAFDVSLGPEEDRKADRFYYPSAAGEYKGSITQFGISVMGHWGKGDEG